ncbi:MAG: cryptochrome/photolyase family protein, partial [Candidatus Promineifilaceae bacterium]
MKPFITVWVLGDQLLDNHPALIQAETEYSREQISVVLIESDQRIAKRPYQKKKIVLLMSAMRHYALRLSERGFRTNVFKAADFRVGLVQYVTKYKPAKLITMAASDYPGRRFQEGQLASILGIPVEIVPNRQFLISVHDPFPDVGKQKRVVMENFYRKMRRHFDVLMEGEVPRGGQWNFDAANRKPLPKGFRPPPLLQFQPDPLTQEVIQEVKYQERGVGTTDGFDLAVTRDQALQA